MDGGQWLALVAVPVLGVGAWLHNVGKARRLRDTLTTLPVVRKHNLALDGPGWSSAYPRLRWPGVDATAMRFREGRHGVLLVFTRSRDGMTLPRVKVEATAVPLLPAWATGGHDLGELAHDAAPLTWRWWSRRDAARADQWLGNGKLRADWLALETLAGVPGLRVRAGGGGMQVEMRARVDDVRWMERALSELPGVVDRLAEPWRASR